MRATSYAAFVSNTGDERMGMVSSTMKGAGGPQKMAQDELTHE